MGHDQYDVIVVGAGFGGAACAALLARRGNRVLLVERNTVPGGKAMTVRGGGFGYELWPVVSGPSVGSRFEQLLTELDALDQVEMLTPDGVMEFVYRDGAERRRMVGAANPTGGDPMAMIQMLGLDDSALPELLRMMTDLHGMDETACSALEGTSFSEWLDGYDLPQPVRTWFGIQANIVFVVPIDELDAGEAVRTFQDFGRGGAGRYHAGGYGRVAEVCCEQVERHGGRVMLGTGVSRVVIEHARVTGVELVDGSRHDAPVVISNAGLQPTVLRLVGAEWFEPDYVEYVRNLRPSRGIVGYRYVMSEPFLERGAYFAFDDESYLTAERFAALGAGWLPEELAVFAVVPSVYDPSLAPDGRQMVLVGTFCDADPQLAYLEPLLERLDESVERIWPGFHGAVESSLAYGTMHVSKASRDSVVPGQGGECVGLAQIVGQCGASKPSARSPIPGLYFVGCDAGGYGCGTHQAVDSALNVAEMVATELAGASATAPAGSS